jgi:hypothetical protein
MVDARGSSVLGRSATLSVAKERIESLLVNEIISWTTR